jgi:hypothetical protein
MKPNMSYFPHFIVGCILLAAAVTILITGHSGGILYSSDGSEAFLNGILILAYSIFLFYKFLFYRDPRIFKWKDAFIMAAIFWGIEIGAHLTYLMINRILNR